MDALERVIKYLEANLDGIRVVQDAPAKTKELGSYVGVSRSGGRSTQFLDTPRLTIDCHSTTGEKAYALSERVKALMIAMPDTDDKVSDAYINSYYRDDWMNGYPCYSLHVFMVINV